MFVGIPKEIKTKEFRVGMTPAGVKELVSRGHIVFVETNAGNGVGFTDEDYSLSGAEILPTAEEVFAKSELIIKVKEPQLNECAMLRKEQTIFTYLHLAADKPQAEALCASGCLAIAYETITSPKGHLPLLQPMSEVAGRLSVQVGATALQKSNGGSGLLLGGVPGVAPANIVIIGGGVSGENALQMAMGARANIIVFERSLEKIAELDRVYGDKVTICYSTPLAVQEAIANADLVIGAVLLPGAAAPRVISREDLKLMKPGSVLVDISIDQGGCFETSKPTTHDNPTYEVDGVIHYCVANMPGGVPKTSTLALTNATLPYILKLVENGPQAAIEADAHLANGVNVSNGKLTHPAVIEALTD
ncbi:alanine dehydrogenase [Hirschia baltica]|uniref:Alanine dehydrogenase n=1 Tax=Hirschia baltica (strain ATCC 49814 / DSM 5838 / IFAM 1418) TaxID=582402 RepID=C6XP18_HIRBI|nr:alanine dehydrogenase [Hirschia baltica]ACT60198.1 alanine dehydrogenase [Hirschia baltica ATCC 49814]